jgi:hypothetical protein
VTLDKEVRDILSREEEGGGKTDDSAAYNEDWDFCYVHGDGWDLMRQLSVMVTLYLGVT